MGTPFTEVYNRFLGKIEDDMYMELTPEDTLRDLQILLVDAIPGFEFPRKVISDYSISVEYKNQNDIDENDFTLGNISNEDDELPVEKSSFNVDLDSEEVNILALLMMNSWLQRQVTSIENIRMKYTGSDFKMTSQANHLSKLLALQSETQRQAFHMQRLYKRRFTDKNGGIHSNWIVFGKDKGIDPNA